MTIEKLQDAIHQCIEGERRCAACDLADGDKVAAMRHAYYIQAFITVLDIIAGEIPEAEYGFPLAADCSTQLADR